MNKQVEQIKAEIERRIREDYNGNEYEDYIAQGVCASMLYYINYPEEETPTRPPRGEGRRPPTGSPEGEGVLC